jgi:hypothetical protein
MPHETITIDTDQWAVVPRKATGEMLGHVMGISIAGTLRHWDELLACAPRPEQNDSYVTIHIDHHDRLECCRRLLEIIAVGDSENPQEDAKQELVAHGFWEERPEPVRQPKPAFWVRRHPDGRLTNEVLSDSVIEQVRKDSGAWIPLFTEHQPAPRPGFAEQLEIKTLSTQLNAVTELLRAREREIAELKKEAPRTVPTSERTGPTGKTLWTATMPDRRKKKHPIPTSERLPTEADADPWNRVAWYDDMRGTWILSDWSTPPFKQDWFGATHWQPTGLQRPPAPGVGS